jgi:hypothetical protein
MDNGGMNEWLAEFYGTAADSDDLQKTAEAELLNKLAEDGDIDIDALDDDEVVALADALGLVEDSGETEGAEGGDWTDGQKLAHITKVAEANDIDIEALTDEEFAQLAAFAFEEGDEANEANEGEDEEFEAKLAEADFIGRTIAHAQFNEMAQISGEFEKEAGRKEMAEALRKRFAAMKAAAGRGAASAKERGAQAGRWAGGPKRSYKAQRATGTGRARSLARATMENKAQAATAAAIMAGGGGAAAYGLRKRAEADMDVVNVELDADAVEALIEAGYEFE